MSMRGTAHEERPLVASARARQLLTVVVVAVIAILGLLAAHHAEARDGAAAYSLSESVHADASPSHSGSSESADSGTVALTSTLVAGCVLLVVCCVIALTVSRIRARAFATRGREPAKKGLDSPTVVEALAVRPRPSLLVLSISRT